MLLLALGEYALLATATGVAVAVILALLMYRTRRSSDASIETEDPRGVRAEQSQQELLDRWRSRAEFTISWADGSRGDWDLHLRPVLAREFEQVTKVRAHGNRAQYQAAGELLFGPVLWKWVDASQTSRAHRDEPGPGRTVLADILARLEHA
ncbi:hypothetical protein [Hoyosella altamirensis]|uniref:Uncharacterized protein n=1 Tax=Hoyosella altamirensis TaxID=616997 RepID=A0A839RLX2_9ACTN|nr:hypothetical protein [Hoyosella altamirensis]MBB3037397.1 hypothetical protein [Hoyosella altamirensis]